MSMKDQQPAALISWPAYGTGEIALPSDIDIRQKRKELLVLKDQGGDQAIHTFVEVLDCPYTQLRSIAFQALPQLVADSSRQTSEWLFDRLLEIDKNTPYFDVRCKIPSILGECVITGYPLGSVSVEKLIGVYKDDRGDLRPADILHIASLAHRWTTEKAKNLQGKPESLDGVLIKLVDTKSNASIWNDLKKAASGSEDNTEKLTQQVCRILNAAIKGNNLFAARQLQNISLRPITRILKEATLSNDCPKSVPHQYLNRLLLEEAYPEIAHSPREAWMVEIARLGAVMKRSNTSDRMTSLQPRQLKSALARVAEDACIEFVWWLEAITDAVHPRGANPWEYPGVAMARETMKYISYCSYVFDRRSLKPLCHLLENKTPLVDVGLPDLEYLRMCDLVVRPVLSIAQLNIAQFDSVVQKPAKNYSDELLRQIQNAVVPLLQSEEAESVSKRGYSLPLEAPTSGEQETLSPSHDHASIATRSSNSTWPAWLVWLRPILQLATAAATKAVKALRMLAKKIRFIKKD